MSDRRYHSSQRHPNSGGLSRSARPSSDQQYVLPATTYAGSGGGHYSGSSNPTSSSGGTLGGIYDQYGRLSGGPTNTPPRRGSQPSHHSGEAAPSVLHGSNPSNSGSGSIPIMLAGSRPHSHQESLHSVYTTASRVVPVGQDGGGRHSAAGARVSNTSSEMRRVEGARRAVGNTAAYIAQMDFGDAEPATQVYGEGSRSAELLARLRRQEQQRAAAGSNPFKKLIQKSREGIDRRLRRKKK